MSGTTTVRIAAILGILTIPILPAVGAEPDAKAALERFDEEWKSDDPAERAAAADRLGVVIDPDVAVRLLKKLPREKVPEVREALCRGLARQKDSVKKIGPGLERLAAREIDEVTKLIRKGVPVDPRTGDADLEKQEELVAMETGERNLAALLRCLLDLDYHRRLGSKQIEPLLQAACNPLVVAVLDAIAAWDLTDALPEVLRLFAMYPTEGRWETGAVNQAGGTNASAKAAWMAAFGHPGKRTARPEVVKAIRRSMSELTGREIEKPEDLQAYIRDPRSRK